MEIKAGLVWTDRVYRDDDDDHKIRIVFPPSWFHNCQIIVKLFLIWFPGASHSLLFLYLSVSSGEQNYHELIWGKRRWREHVEHVSGVAAKGFVQMQMQTLHSPRFRILPEKLVVLHLLSASVHSWPTRPLPCPFPCHFTMSKHHVCVRSLHGEQGAAAMLMNIGEWLDCGPVGYAISGLCKTLVLCCSFMFLHVAALLII